MSVPPHLSPEAEPGSAAPPREEPRLLTRDRHPGSEAIVERHRLLSLEDAHDAPVRPNAKSRLAGAVARLHRKQLHTRQDPEPRRARERGAGRRWLLLALVLVGVTLLLAGGVSFWVRHAMRAALPQIDGTLAVAGLEAPVQVTRDAEGVPSITAANLDDLLFAQGFITAQDRLWQMDAFRRNASGNLAEILGSTLVEHDRRQRVLRIRAAADHAVASLPPEQLAQLDAYARGVNAEIALAADHLPVEFRLLHYRPAPWTPRDTLLISLAMAQDLGTSFPQKLNREALAAHLPPALLADLYPIGSWRDRPPTQAPLDLTTPRDVPEIPLDETQIGLLSPVPAPTTSPEDLLRVSSALRPCTECRAGSNNWAVAAARSASGAPLLANDMHLQLSAPDIWYEAGLHIAGVSTGATLDAVGFTLPGVPFVIVGHNARVAWGFTNLGGDVQDLRVEHLCGSGLTTEYQRADRSWAPVGHHAEVIHVRGGRDVTLDVMTTTAPLGAATVETPLLSPLYPSMHRTLSLLWAVYDPAVLRSPFLAVNQAADGPSLVAALGSFGAPSLNLVWADSGGHIGYHAVGRIPIRGPAVHRPRAVEQLVVPDNVPAEDQQDESAPGEGDGVGSKAAPPPGKQSRWSPPSGRVRLTLAAFQAVRSRRGIGAAHLRKAAPPRTAERSQRGRRPVGKRDLAKHPATATQPPAAQTQQQALPPAAAALDYTVGSPLSPTPVDALDPAQQWSGYIAFSDLPAAQDPSNGVLATANSRVTADDYPYALTLDWVDPYRTERIYKLLEGRRQLTPADLLAVQNDVHSELDRAIAQRVAYAIDHASAPVLAPDRARLRQAADMLRRWDGDVRADRSAPAIVAALRAELLPTLIAAQVARHDGLRPGAPESLALAALYGWGGAGTALELLLQHTPAAWLPPGVANWNDLLAMITSRALDHAHAPRDLASWRYGAIHTIEIDHPVLGTRAAFGDLLGAKASSGRFPADGDGSTIKAIARQHGPSERFVADLASGGVTLGNITTGESGNPASPWFMDQFLPWLRGTSFALPLEARSRDHALTLVPAGGR